MQTGSMPFSKAATRQATGPTRRDVVGGIGAATAAAMLPGIAAAAADGVAVRTATDLTQALASRQVSSRELVDACIARIEALDPKINAVVVRDFDRARQAADDADAALARGNRRPLLGLPMTVKEQYNVVGLPTTWGLPQFRNWQPQEDSLVITRLKQAGAIILGKTNVPRNLADWQSYNEIYGTTNNPWDLSRTPGGSSGGAAAALAAGFVPLELGSDIGGSLRAPAHFCGVFAHKPSIGLVPMRGAGPPETPLIPLPDDMAVIGPMARSAADLGAALDVLAGPDELWSGIGYKLALPDARHGKLADFRVLILDAHPLCPTATSIQTDVETLLGNLMKAGATVMRRLPDMPELAHTTRVYVELLMAFFAADLPAERRVQLEAIAAGLAPEDLRLEAAEMRGFAMTHAAWTQTSRIRIGLRARWQAMFKQVDVILCPPMPTLAFPHDHAPLPQRRLDINGKRVFYDDQIAWAAIATMVGLPSTTLPIGLSDSGLPVGVQVIGGYLEDRTTIAFAGMIEQAFGGFRSPPAFA